MPQEEDLGVLVPAGTREHGEPAEYPQHGEAGES